MIGWGVMNDSDLRGQRRERKRRKKREMRKSGRSFVTSVRSAIRKRLGDPGKPAGPTSD